MNTRHLLVLALLGMVVVLVDSTLILTTAAVGTTAASALAAGVAAAGLGALAVLKAALIGRAISRGKRDLAQQQEDQAVDIALDVASQLDAHGCIAKLLCEIEATPDSELTLNMAIFKNAFGKQKTLRGSFDIAINFGSKIVKGDPKACERLFEKCLLPKEELLAMLDSTLSC